ncbi:MAG: hypothetical protein KC591_07510, partial [Gemmatimonadetes bacterium]|nr:hypothetical protein [Gemmatimonadota bacterium]
MSARLLARRASRFSLGLVLVGILATSRADACRCIPRPFADYFHDADEVVIARLVDVRPVSPEEGDVLDLSLDFELVEAPYRTWIARKEPLRRGERVTYVTSSSSASCGLETGLGTIYVLFARAQDLVAGPLGVYSCDGSRPAFVSDAGSSQDFVDVPARFVVSRLESEQALDVLRQVAAREPRPDDPTSETFLGLLDLQALAHGGVVVVRAAPDAAAEEIARIDSYDGLVTREVDYEVPAAVVTARTNGWFRIRLASGDLGWVAPQEAGTWFPYDELLPRRLAYLNRHWDGFVWPDPGAGLPARSPRHGSTDRAEYAIDVHEATRLAGSLWFRIDVLSENPCEGGDPRPELSGWVPAYGADG